ncbi:lipopolysaccharide biosynthesis protein [Jatrophihabitans sp.]|uniref:lipopolysaccharide biosynthesis protein n=1 Tax=Jatrophihabitans sp. TaxID=1932789 RepID=UPI0030C6E749
MGTDGPVGTDAPIAALGADGPASTDGLGRRAARGAAATLVGQAVRVMIQLGGLVVLGRILDPKDYGILAAVTAFIGVGDLLRDFGLSSAAVQAKTLTLAQRTNLFWLNTGIGVILAVATFCSASPIASFYHNPHIAGVVRSLAVIFILDGMATQYRADMIRNLKFGRLAMVDIVAQGTGLIVGVVLGLAHYHYHALVAQQLVQAAVAVLAVVGIARWVPRLPRRHVPMRAFIGFGVNLMATQLLTYFSRNVDSLTVGHRFGPRVLGIYNRAFQLLTLPLNQLNAPALQVALPILSRLQDQPAKFAAFVVRGQLVLLNISLVLFAGLGSQARPLLPLVFGHQWSGSVPIFQILAVGGIFQAAGFSVYWIFLSKGMTRSSLRYSLTIRPIAIALIIGGSIWGVRGVASGYALGVILAWPVGLWWVGRVADAPAGQLLRSGLRSILAYATTAVVAAVVPRLLVHAAIAQAGLGIVVLVATFAAIVALWPAFRRDVQEVWATAQLLRGGRAAVEASLEPRGRAAQAGASGRHRRN